MRTMPGGHNLSKLTWNERLQWYETLEVDAGLSSDEDDEDSPGNRKKRNRRGKKDRSKKRKPDVGGDSDRPKKRQKTGGDKKRTEACKHCGKFHLAADSECWTLDKNKEKKPKREFKPTKPKGERAYQITQEEISRLIAALPTFQEKPKPKRKVSADSDSENKSATSSVTNSDYAEQLHVTRPKENRPIKRSKSTHLTTEVIVEIEDRNGDRVPIKCLLDTGTSATLILRQYVARGKAKGYKGHATNWNTMGGTFTTKRKALLEFKLPEFSTNKRVQWVCHVDDTSDKSTAQYDMIIGNDLMTEIGLDICFSAKKIRWENDEIPMKHRGSLANAAVTKYLHVLSTDTALVQDAEARQKRILDANYDAINIREHVATLEHLDRDQKEHLIETLTRHPQLFSGGLGELNIKPIRLELIKGAKPYHARPFPVPKAYEAVTKKEIDRLTSIGVLKKSHDSEWAAPTFIQPKKTGDVRVLTDFRQLNKFISRRPFPLPKIADLLQKLEGFRWATAIDLSMGYYHIPLDRRSQRLCTTILPWGKYQYLRLPMGVTSSPDVFQSIMMEKLGDLEYARAYIDDILITTSGSYEDHLEKLNEVLRRLSEAGFRVNVTKCSFATDKLEYLGYWLTRNGIQPQPKKVEAILRLSPPKDKRQLRHFLGMINYYRDMWQRRSHHSAPLTGLVSKTAKFIWGPEQQKAFDTIRKIISRETLLAFPDFNKEFHIYTDASAYQLGAVIMQDDRPLAFYSRKMNAAQRRYTTGEKELLSVVETLKEFKNILLGQRIIVHTDHMNIVYGHLSNDRIARWRLLLEEYGPTYEHVAGKTNVVADALSRLDADFETEAPSADNLGEMSNTFAKAKEVTFPMSPTLIAKYQKTDKTLIKNIGKDLSKKDYGILLLEGTEVVTQCDKVYIPAQLQSRVVAWYHQYLAHPGQTRLEATIKQVYTWPRMREHVQQYCRTCDKCQLSKKQRPKYGLLPAKEAETTPWKRVNVDLIGPYTIRIVTIQPNKSPVNLER